MPPGHFHRVLPKDEYKINGEELFFPPLSTATH
jgi:hypothetical protein